MTKTLPARTTWLSLGVVTTAMLCAAAWSPAFDQPGTQLPEGELFSLEVAASDSMLAGPDRTLPVYIDGRNQVRGVLWLREARNTGRVSAAAGRNVYLVENDKVLAQAVTEADGYFTLQAPRAGRYRVVGSLEGLDPIAQQAGLNRPRARLANFQVDGKTEPAKADPAPAGFDVPAEPKAAEPKAAEPKAADPKADLPAPADPADPKPAEEPKQDPNAPEMADDFFDIQDGSFPLGTPPNGNARVFLDNDGVFRFHDAKHLIHHASNDEVFLDDQSIFRGVVTMLDENLKRRPLMRAYLFLVQNGKVISRSLTTKNGSFRLGPVPPGGYTIVAAYGARTQKGEFTKNGGNGAATALASTKTKAAGRDTLNYLQSGVVTEHTIAANDPEFQSLMQGGAQQLAIQQIAIREKEQAVKLGPVTEFQKRGSPVVVQVKFQQPGVAHLPLLHLSPSPLIGTLQTLAGTAAAQPLAGGAAGGAAPAGLGGGGGGGGIGGAAGGGLFPPPFFPPSTNPTAVSTP